MSGLPVALFTLAAIASLVFFLRFCNRPQGRAKSVIKTASTALLAITAVVLDAPVWLSLALTLGALGDLLLSREGETTFLAGLIAFALAHLAYVILFATEGNADLMRLEQGGRGIAALLVLAFGGAMGRLLWPATGALRWPVMGYIGIILAMGLTALALPATAGPWPLVAALCFIASDTILAAELFRLPAAHPARRVTPYAIWALYWTAQAVFLLAFAPLSGG